MEWTDWVDLEPETKTDIKTKIENDGYTFPHYKYNCHFESIVVEKNSVMGPNQQSMISIGIVTGIILGRLIADNVYFVNVSTWRKYWKFSYKDRSKKSMKLQAVAKVSDEFDLNVKDDEADAILIGSYFVNHGQEFGNLENHKVS